MKSATYFKIVFLFVCASQIEGQSRAKGGGEGGGDKQDVMSKILPMMVMPFITQTTMLPMMLMSLKFMLLQSMFLGKMAVLLGFITFIRNLLKKPGGFYSHNVNVMQPHSHHRRIYKFSKRKWKK